MKKITDEEVRVRQLEILDFIDTVCKENNIAYQLGFGTLIGAVRHQGFIPWDDDIDLCLYREDYIRLAQAIKAKNDPRFQIMDYENTDWYFQNFMVVVDKSSIMYQKETRLKNHVHIFVDIFVIDQFDDLKVVEKTYTQFALKSLRIYKIKRIFHKDNILKDIARFITWCGVSFVPPRHFTLKHEKLIKAYTAQNGHYEGILGQDKGKYKNVFPNGTFKPIIYLPFENKLYPVPANYHDILTQLYGDYMQVPSEDEKIQASHNIEAYEVE